MFVDSSNFCSAGFQSNFALFIVVISIFLTIPAGPQCEKDLPDFIDGLVHPQGRGILVTWLMCLVVKSDTQFPLFGDVASKKMPPSDTVVLVDIADIGIVDGRLGGGFGLGYHHLLAVVVQHLVISLGTNG